MLDRQITWGILVLLITCGSAVGQLSIADMPLSEEPMELLKDRIRIQMPPGAESPNALANSVMAAPPAADEEDRVILQINSEKLVVVAYETFNTAGEDFQRHFAEQVSSWGKQADVKFLAKLWGKPEDLDAGKAVGLLYRPKEISQRGMANEVISALLTLPDRTVLWVRIFANADAAANPNMPALAEKILKSIQPGSRELDTHAGPRGLWIYSQQRELSLTLPANYVVTRMTGPDFLVYHARPLVPFGNTPSGVSVYYGSAPAYQYRQQPQQVDVEKVPDTLFGQEIEWHVWSQAEGNHTRTYWETLIPGIVPGDPTAVLHVFFNYTEDSSLMILKAIARSMKIAPKIIPPESE